MWNCFTKHKEILVEYINLQWAMVMAWNMGWHKNVIVSDVWDSTWKHDLFNYVETSCYKTVLVEMPAVWVFFLYWGKLFWYCHSFLTIEWYENFIDFLPRLLANFNV